MPKRNYQTQLSCDHFIDFDGSTAPPRIREELWCRKCRCYAKVVSARVEYRRVCMAERPCPRRSHGQALLNAQRAADKHFRLLGHVAAVMYGSYTISWHPAHAEFERQLKLFELDEDLPPF
jgi:hypothetical protein